MKKKLDSKVVSGRGGPNLPTLQRVLVPIDFSDSSLSALRYAVALAMEFDATLTVLHVVPADYGWLGIG